MNGAVGLVRLPMGGGLKPNRIYFLLSAQLRRTVPQTDPRFDLIADGLINKQDVDELVLNRIDTLYGDANLDRAVDGIDFGIWNENKFQRNTGWSSGDFNGDSVTDVQDFKLWNANRFTSQKPIVDGTRNVSPRLPRAALAARNGPTVDANLLGIYASSSHSTDASLAVSFEM